MIISICFGAGSRQSERQSDTNTEAPPTVILSFFLQLRNTALFFAYSPKCEKTALCGEVKLQFPSQSLPIHSILQPRL